MVSELCLGCMTFGQELDEEGARDRRPLPRDRRQPHRHRRFGSRRTASRMSPEEQLGGSDLGEHVKRLDRMDRCLDRLDRFDER
jgi:hypothetical protein